MMHSNPLIHGRHDRVSKNTMHLVFKFSLFSKTKHIVTKGTIIQNKQTNKLEKGEQNMHNNLM